MPVQDQPQPVSNMEYQQQDGARGQGSKSEKMGECAAETCVVLGALTVATMAAAAAAMVCIAECLHESLYYY